MSESKKNRPLASQLLSGELTPEAVDALLERAERDPELSAELDLVADITAAAELERERLIGAVAAPAGSGPAVWRRLWFVGAAALAAGLLALWASGLLQGPAGTRDAGRSDDLVALADSAPPPFVETEMRGATRAGAISLKAEFTEAMGSYVAGDWPAVELDLTGFLAAYPEHGPARFYRGVARLELGRFEAGLGDLGAVAADDAGFLGEHARWRAALAHLRRGELDRARALLEELRALDGAFAPNATELLLELERR